MGLFGRRSVEELRARGDVEGLVRAALNPNPRQIGKPARGRQAAVDALTARNAAIRALWALKSFEALASLLDQPDRDIRREVVSSLGRVMTADALDLLARAARDPDELVRQWATREICGLAGTRSSAVVIELLNDGNRGVRISSLSGIDDWLTSTSHMDTRLPGEVAQAIAALASSDPDDLVREVASNVAGRIAAEGRTEPGTQIPVPPPADADVRTITFSMPCSSCGYRTNVSVTMTWMGEIVSGKGSSHSFVCQNCQKMFSVPLESLKEYTNRFV